MSQFNSNGHLALLDPGGALSARIHFKLRLLFFFCRKHAFLLFDFYYFGDRQFLMKMKFIIFYPTPSRRGILKKKFKEPKFLNRLS